jgi:hypothetical protein
MVSKLWGIIKLYGIVFPLWAIGFLITTLAIWIMFGSDPVSRYCKEIASFIRAEKLSISLKEKHSE